MSVGYKLQGTTNPLYAMNLTYNLGNPNDLDGDGILNANDSCPTQAGVVACNGCPLNVCGACGTAVDTDGDSLADCVDLDDDNDGYPDGSDAFPLDAMEWADSDGDGQGDNADLDDDNDTVADGSDNCRTVANPSQTDCNGNGIGEACEAFSDCNSDGVPDSCEIAQGVSTDCNGDGIPDTCQGAYGTSAYAQNSGNLGAPSGVVARTFTFADLPLAEGDATVTIDVRGDLNGANEWIDISLNGGAPTRFFESNGNICPATPDRATITLSDQAFNALIAVTGQLVVTMTCPATVDPTECKGAELTAFSLGYLGFDPAQGDCNGNQQFDFCEIVAGVSPDCNGNGRPDSCDIASGAVSDCNSNGVLDTCETGGGSPYAGAIQWTTAEGGNNHWYYPLTTLQHWQPASDAAGAIGGHLATVHSEAENTFVRTLLPATTYYWIGGTQPVDSCEPSCAWGWVSGEPWNYTNWDVNEPNDYQGISEDQVMVVTSGKWWDAGLNWSSAAIVEWETDVDCNGNGVPDSCDLSSGAADCNANGVIDTCESDADGDGAIDPCDNCPALANPAQADCDGDGSGDACELASGSPDIDGNGVPDECQTVMVSPGASIQDAINSAPSSTMRIVALSAGTYWGPVNFLGKPIILRGAGAASTTISGTGGQSTSVIRLGYEPAIAAIEGVRITAGSTGSPHPDNPNANVGGGVFMYRSSASMRDCVIEGNGAGFGGGGYFAYSMGEIERCTFRDNYAAVDGGGVQLYDGVPLVRDCVIEDNDCNDGRGGGVHIVYGNATLVGTQIRSNRCGGVGGGLTWVPATQPWAYLTVAQCEITGNSAGIANGGLRVVDASGVARMSLEVTTVCGNTPRPNVQGEWDDLGGNSICDCVSDLNVDGVTNGVDLAQVLADWGTCGSCPGDLDGDGVVGGTDLAQILAGWGACDETPPQGPPPLAWATTIEAYPDPAVVTDASFRQRMLEANLPWRVRDNASNIEMLLVPPGTFMMGCSASDSYGCSSSENPVHEVTLTSAFYMGRTEVTQAQWQNEMGNNPSVFAGFSDSPSRPVERVPWNTIQGFLVQNSLRLPTEAEWEYAYRAGTTTAFHGYAGTQSGTNDDGLLGNIAWFAGNSSSQTHPVGGKLGNGFGLHDMAGNVYEWVHDRWGYYPSGAVTNPQGPGTGFNCVVRGGSAAYPSLACRASQRRDEDPTGSFTVVSHFGFRVARTP